MEVKGNGYTDHCPYCLWSRHVDINPGDRLAKCKGLMKPIHAVKEGENIVIYYKCIKCGIEKRVKAAKDDNEELLYQLINASIGKRA